MTKTHGRSTLAKTVMPKPLAAQKGTFVAFASNQPVVDQPADDKKKGPVDKVVLVDPNDIDKKLHLNMKVDPK
jgi:hypothetical protein